MSLANLFQVFQGSAAPATLPRTHRPRSIEKLRALARPATYDSDRSFKDQLHAIGVLRSQSILHHKKGDLENAFLYMARAAALILEKLPSHAQYDILSSKQKIDLAAVESVDEFMS